MLAESFRRAGVSGDIVGFPSEGDLIDAMFSPAGSRQHPLLVVIDRAEVGEYTALTRIKGDENTRHIPVFVLAATDDAAERRICYDLGCNLYIAKPEAPEVFASAMFRLGEFLAVMALPGKD